MNTIFKTAFVTFLIAIASSRCYALQKFEAVHTLEDAQELGVIIRSQLVASNQVAVWLEFAPRGKLKDFLRGQLEVSSTGGEQFIRVALMPIEQNSDKVVLFFLADPGRVKISTLTIVVGPPLSDHPSVSDGLSATRAQQPKLDRGSGPNGYSFAIKDFVKMPPNKSP